MQTHLLKQSTAEALVLIISEQVASAQNGLEKLGDVNNLEALHDFRVSARRLRVWLKVCRTEKILRLPKADEKRLKQLVAMTNEARDLEVRLAIFSQYLKANTQYDDSFATELKRKWTRTVDKAYEKLLIEVPKGFGKTRASLNQFLNDMRKHARKKFNKIDLGEFLKPVLLDRASKLDKALKTINSIGDVEQCHRSRLLAKSLRYLIEAISTELQAAGPLLNELRRLQDLIGGLRDALMLSHKLEKVVEDPGYIKKEQDALEAAVASNAAEVTYLFDEIQKNYLTAREQNFEGAVVALFAYQQATR